LICARDRVGILNTNVNPAELANLSKKFEINFYGLSFDVSNNKIVQGLGAKAENMYFHSDDDLKEKYIKMLEEENKLLKK
jgi:hypothetical protein